MEKKEIIIFYKDGKAIDKLKNDLKNWIIDNNIYCRDKSNKDFISSELFNIHFLDLSYRNLDKFLERYPNFDFGIDVNVDEIYNVYPDRIPNDISSINWDETVENYIKNLYGYETIYVLEGNNVVKKEISKIDLKKYSDKYFKSIKEVISKLKEYISFNETQIQYHSGMIDKYKMNIQEKQSLLKKLEK